MLPLSHVAKQQTLKKYPLKLQSVKNESFGIHMQRKSIVKNESKHKDLPYNFPIKFQFTLLVVGNLWATILSRTPVHLGNLETPNWQSQQVQKTKQYHFRDVRGGLLHYQIELFNIHSHHAHTKQTQNFTQSIIFYKI